MEPSRYSIARKGISKKGTKYEYVAWHVAKEVIRCMWRDVAEEMERAGDKNATICRYSCFMAAYVLAFGVACVMQT